MTSPKQNQYTNDSRRHELKASSAPLRAKMAPLILLVSLTIGGLTPWLYQESQKLSTQREAKFMASSLLVSLKEISARSPRLWVYQPQEIERVISPLERLGALIECVTSTGRVIYQSDQIDADGRISAVESTTMSSANNVMEVSIKVSLHSHQQIDTTISWLLGLLMALLLSWLLWTIPLKSARLADAQNQALLREIINLNLDLERRIQERTLDLEQLTERLFTIQEEERARISRDLHDELGQTLTGLRLHLTTLSLSDLSDKQHLIDQCLEIVDLGIDQVRTIAYEQRPPELNMLGLIDAVRAMARRLSNSEQLSIRVVDCDLPKLSETLLVAIFRFCQEGITNAIRHGNSSEITIHFDSSPPLLIVRVDDNGSGHAAEIEWGGGLRGLESRLRSQGSTLQLDDSPLGGLAMIAHFPMVI